MPVPGTRRLSDSGFTLNATYDELFHPSGIAAVTRAATYRYLARTWLRTLLSAGSTDLPNQQRLKTRWQETALSHWFRYLIHCGVAFRPRKTIRGALQEYLDVLNRAGLTSDEVLWLDRGAVAWAVLGRAPAARPDRPCLAASWSFPIAEESLPQGGEEGLVIQVTQCMYRTACRLVAQSTPNPAECARTIEFFEAIRRVARIETEARLVQQAEGVCQLNIWAKM